MQVQNAVKKLGCSLKIELSGVVPSRHITHDADMGRNASTGVYQTYKLHGHTVPANRIFTMVGALGPAKAALESGSSRHSHMKMAVLSHATYVLDAVKVGAWALSPHQWS